MLVLGLCRLVSATALAGVSVRIEPGIPTAGSRAQLVLVSDTGTPPELAARPRIAGMQWIGSGVRRGSNYSNRNGVVTTEHSAGYTVVFPTPGTVRIPALRVNLGGQVVNTQPLRVQVVKARARTRNGETVDLQRLVFSRLSFDDNPEPPATLYVGQELVLRLEVFVHADLYQEMGYPEPDIENVTFRDYSVENPDQPHFRRANLDGKVHDGMAFRHAVFECTVTPLAAGKLAGQFVVPMKLRRGRADRLLPGYARGERRDLVHKLERVKVVPLPTLQPDAGQFLGLVGEWHVEVSTDKAEVPARDFVSLTLEARGTGNPDNFIPPELDLDGFRVLEPEVAKERENERDGTARITWGLVPVSESSRLPELAFSTFSVEQERYVTVRDQPALTVLPATPGGNTGTLVSDHSQSDPSTPAEMVREAVDILPLHDSLGTPISPAVVRSPSSTAVALLVLGPLGWLALTLYARRREKLLGSETMQRRARARRAKRGVFAALEHAPADQLPDVVRKDLVPCLADWLDLPPGITAGELAERVADKHADLAAELRKAEHSGFMPGQNGDIEGHRLVKAAGKIFVLATLLLAGSTPVCAEDPAAPATLFAAAAEAYTRGDPRAALETYRKIRTETGESAALLYNMANCQYRLGEPGHAIALYERARRLAPRDSDIRQSLRFIRSQLALPEPLSPRNPVDLLVILRDSLRPDEWWLVAGVLVTAWGGVAGVCRLRNSRPWIVYGAFALALLAALGSALSQRTTTYRPNSHAVVTVPSAALRSLPLDTADRLEAVLRRGEGVELREERPGWSRVRLGQAEGWLPAEHVAKVW